MTLILIASVGSSAAPIASALAARRPDVVLFLATDEQESSPGSAKRVPGILERAQRPRQPHAILTVPPDDPEAIFLALRERLRRLREEHPDARLVFDYTGGTKSMTSALFQCALATPGAELQFMAGTRETLDRVTAGTERATRIPVDWLLAERAEARLREAWRSFAYAEAAEGTAALLHDLETDEKAPPEARLRLRDFAEASRAFDHWDRFAHAEAARILGGPAARHPGLAPHARLAAACAQGEAARLADLWRNAERCAARGRFDDAVARCYRLIEWVGQWRLRERHGIDAGSLDWSRITEQEAERARIADRRASGARTLSGLVQTLELAAVKEPEGAIARFLRDPYPGKKKKDGAGRLRDMLDLRNPSILAHGTKPLGPEEWRRMAEFMEHFRGRVVAPLLREAGADPAPPQLPQAPPGTM